MLPHFKLYCKAPVSEQYGTSTETDTRSMEQNREPRIEPTLTGSINLQQKNPRIYNRKKTAPSINGAGKTGQLHGKESD